MCNNIDCLNEGILYCGRCGVARYCSKTCQTQHWKLHKLTCRKTAELQTPVDAITKELRGAIKKSDHVLANELYSKLDELCSDNRDGIIELANKISPKSLDSDIYFGYDKMPLSVMRDDIQKSLDEISVIVDRSNKEKIMLDNEKLKIEDIIEHFIKHKFGTSKECLEYQESLTILKKKITELDDMLILYNELKCRMNIIIRDIYTVRKYCITCGGSELKDNTIYRCKLCRMAYYCSEACIISDSTAHKRSCKKLF